MDRVATIRSPFVEHKNVLFFYVKKYKPTFSLHGADDSKQTDRQGRQTDHDQHDERAPEVSNLASQGLRLLVWFALVVDAGHRLGHLGVVERVYTFPVVECHRNHGNKRV